MGAEAQHKCSKLNNLFSGLHLLVSFVELSSGILKKFENNHKTTSHPEPHQGDEDNRNLSQPTFYCGVAAKVMYAHWNISIC